MIVIGVDVHKHSLMAVVVDEAGRMLDEKTVAAADDGLVAWASELGGERLWALEDCRQLTRWLERELLAAGEELVRVPPKLMAPERRAGRARGKSDPIDALAVARAALREPRLSRPRPDEQPFRDLKLLVDHREDLVDERRRGAALAARPASTTLRRHQLRRHPHQLLTGRHRIAITQARYHPAARAYLERKQAEGKSRREAIRCLKRQLSSSRSSQRVSCRQSSNAHNRSPASWPAQVSN